MAIIIDVLEEIIVPPPIEEVPASRTIKYTARENGGTMYYWIRGGLDAEADLQTLVTSIAQELFDDAEANGTPLPDLVTKVYIEKRRIPYFLKAWEVLRDQMQDTVTAPLGTTLTNNILAELADDPVAADFFEALVWRFQLVAGGTITTQLTPAVVNAMSAANQRILFQLILEFMALGLGVGLTGNFILDDYLS